MKTRRIFSTICMFAVMFILMSNSSCENSSVQNDKEIVNKQMDIYQKSQPTPLYDYSLERDLVIQLYNARQAQVRTWVVWRSDYGMIEGDAACIGFPIPYDVQLTNPLQRVYDGAVVEQSEPNGLYSSKNTSATWIMQIIDVPGKGTMVTPVYIESKVTCYPYPVDVDYEHNRVRPAKFSSAPSVSIQFTKKLPVYNTK